jgi:Mrp family chromosome partitioning ATPase
MDENLSGFDMQEYWEYMHKFNSDFNKIFGVKNERTNYSRNRHVYS